MSAAPTTTAPTAVARRRPTPAQVAVACAEIAELARRLDREFYFGGQTPESGNEQEIPERTVLFLDRLRQAIAHMGWLADLGADGKVRDDPFEWLLPPAFFWKEKSAAGAEGGAT